MAPQKSSFRDVRGPEAEALLAGATLLDVRSPEEHEALGHLPGALLLPLELIASAPAFLPDGPVLVYCEHGVRSRSAAAFLARAGHPEVLNLAGGMAAWRGPREFGPSLIQGPSSWLLANLDLARPRARTLDVACGRGRHALLLAAAGYPVRAVDHESSKIQALREVASRLGVALEAEVLDLATSPLGTGFDLVLVFRYLDRELFPGLREALAPGGVLLYETFTLEQAKRGRPTRAEYLLEPGELPKLVAPLEVVRQREGEYPEGFLSAVAARKPD